MIGSVGNWNQYWWFSCSKAVFKQSFIKIFYLLSKIMEDTDLALILTRESENSQMWRWCVSLSPLLTAVWSRASSAWHLVQTSFRNNIFSIIGHRDHFYQSSLGKWIRRFISMPATRETLMTEVGGGDEVFNPADVLLVSVPSSLTLSPQPVRFPAKSYSLFAETSLAWKLVPVYLYESVGLFQSVKASLMRKAPFNLVSSVLSI